MANTFVPAEVFPPGEIIRQELEERGWTQADLAEVMGRPLQAVNEILSAKKRITEETAHELELALGIDAELWLRNEALYRLHRAPKPSPVIARRAALRKRVPLRLMQTRRWVTATESLDDLEAQVLRHLEVPSLDQRASFSMAAKQTKYEEPLSPTQEVWLLQAKHLAQGLIAPRYSEAKLRDAVEQMYGLLKEPEDVQHVPRLLTEAGVRFVIVEYLPGLKIDGVCFWLDEGTKPVIAMSMTHDRIDNFWFVLRHECEHVLNGDGKKEAIIDNDLDKAPANQSEQERKANAAAADFCVPAAQLDDFIGRKGPLFTHDNIWRFAQTINRHSGLVAGQLRKRLSAGPLGEKAWKLYTGHLVKVRQFIIQTALVDGFGSTPLATA